MILIDSNILIDIFTDDPNWADWSKAALLDAAVRGRIGINPLIYAEVSIAFRAMKSVDSALEPLELMRWELPYAAGFVAGKAFLAYKKRGGERRSPLPDFYIGAHASVAGFHLFTRDVRRYQSYFPEVSLLAPKG